MGKDQLKAQTSSFTNRCVRPNFLILMVEGNIVPSIDETNELKEQLTTRFPIIDLLRENGFECKRHYTGSTSGLPSWSTFLTGQYPSLYHVSNLQRGAIPSIGDYFGAAGYRTYWKGLRSDSQVEITIKGIEKALVIDSSINRVVQNSDLKDYAEVRLNDSECNEENDKGTHFEHASHANAPAIGEKGENMSCAEEVIDLLQQFEKEAENTSPWMIISSFKVPYHRQVRGVTKENGTGILFAHDSAGAEEALLMKDGVELEASQNRNDREVRRVFKALQRSRFYQDTIILFLSHHVVRNSSNTGRLHQNHGNTYEETIHVPMIMHNPALFPVQNSTEMLTSHVDILPTLLALAGIDDEEIQAMLSGDNTKVRPFVGRDLSPMLMGRKRFYRSNEPLYFMSDGIKTHEVKESVSGSSLDTIVQYNQIEAIITTLRKGNDSEVWKYSRYFNHPQIDETTCGKDVPVVQMEKNISQVPAEHQSVCIPSKTTTLQDRYELYNLTKDPLEEKNLVNPAFSTTETREIETLLNMILAEQTRQKTLSPR